MTASNALSLLALFLLMVVITSFPLAAIMTVIVGGVICQNLPEDPKE